MFDRSTRARLALLTILASPLAFAAESSDTVSLVLPQGDPAAGRATFLKLGCPKCHSVAGDKDFPVRNSTTPGPTLGAYQGQMEASRLGMSIFAPSHELTGVVRNPDEGSPMPDFTNKMTVREFLDIIAFLQSP